MAKWSELTRLSESWQKLRERAGPGQQARFEHPTFTSLREQEIRNLGTMIVTYLQEREQRGCLNEG